MTGSASVTTPIFKGRLPPSLSAMEGLIINLPKIGRLLEHLTETPHEIRGEDMAWIGAQITNIGHELEELFYAVHRECGGSGRGE